MYWLAEVEMDEKINQEELIAIVIGIKQDILSKSVDLLSTEIVKIQQHTASLPKGDTSNKMMALNFSKYFISGILDTLVCGLIIDKNCYYEMQAFYDRQLDLIAHEGEYLC
jgi:hypothetical protein